MKFNYYKNLTAKKALQQIELSEFLNWIKNPNSNPAYEQIQKVRDSVSKEEKDKNKEQIPCFLFPYTTINGEKTLSSINGTTGCLFLDIDNPEFVPEQIINKEYMIACYKSSGGNGYHILLSVKNLSNDKTGFQQQTNEIAEYIGIGKYVDKNAIKRTQLAFLSFDENAIINHEYQTYEFTPFVPTSVITKEDIVYMNDMGTNKSVRFDDIDEIPFDNDESYRVDFNDGFEITKAFLIPFKLSDNRYNTLLAYCNNLVYLNQHISKEKAIDILTSVSNIISVNGYDKDRIKKIIDTIFKYKQEGKLEPIKLNKKRKIIFNPMAKTKLTKEEKQIIVLDKIAENKINQSKSKLQDIIDNWSSINGKVTVRNIANNFSINIKTVAKYYPLFREKVKLINSFVPTSMITKKPIVYMNDMGTRNWKMINPKQLLFIGNDTAKKSHTIQFMSTERFNQMMNFLKP